MNKHRLLLASLSPRRRELLELLGLPFDVTTPDVPEEPEENERAIELAIRLSQAKAHAASVEPIRTSVRPSTTIGSSSPVILSWPSATKYWESPATQRRRRRCCADCVKGHPTAYTVE